MKAAILYITFNRLEYTRESLPKLLTIANEHDFDVYIYDNGSTDGTQDYLCTHRRVKDIVYLEKNLGIAPVQNMFWERVCHEYDFVGKIDNDIIVPHFWIDACIDRINAIKDSGVISLWHWHCDWINSIEKEFLYIHGIENTFLAQTSHVGGNYLMRSDLYREFGGVQESLGLKGGFTKWQWNLNKSLIRHGFIFPFDMMFHNIPVYEEGGAPKKSLQEAKRILEMRKLR